MPYTRQRYSGIIKQNAPAVRNRYNPYELSSYAQQEQQPIGRFFLGALQALNTPENKAPQESPYRDLTMEDIRKSIKKQQSSDRIPVNAAINYGLGR